MKIFCFVRHRYINQGCGVGETISMAPAPTIPAPEKYTTVVVTPAPNEQNALAAPASAPVLAKMSAAAVVFVAWVMVRFFNYHLLTLVNKLSGAEGSSFIPRTDTGGSSFISDPRC